MGYKSDLELDKKYKEIMEIFLRDGFDVTKDMQRDYMLKIKFSRGDKNFGKLIIYHSPKKNSFTYKMDSDMEEDFFNYLITMIDNKKVIQSYENNNTEMDDNLYKIYVDGSYLNEKVGYGAIILEGNQPVMELYGEVQEEYAKSSRQVGGEIFAVIEALKWCKDRGIKKVSIYYDFLNLEKWAKGEYKTNNTLTKIYKNFIDLCGIEIEWFKIKSHTGVEWNEKADLLAKRAISPNN